MKLRNLFNILLLLGYGFILVSMHIDTKTIKLIQNALRRSTVMWHVKNEVIKESKTRNKIGVYKNGKDKYKNKFKCAKCEKLWNDDQVEVDHIIEVAHDVLPPSKMRQEDLFQWISQLFCEKSNLQVLCIGCHQAKTNNFNSGKHKVLKHGISLI
tara:strand:- start:14 stop:478 length:465 start_codon:yes stop_codon:yes gene_type:complete